MRWLILLIALGLQAAETGGDGLLDRLERRDASPGGWRALLVEREPGPEVEAEAREAWRKEREQERRIESAVARAFIHPLAPVAGEPTPEQVADDPDRLIPVAARLAGSADPAQRDRGVTCLIQFQLTRARADALRPLLPWLNDPAWSRAPDRLRLIQSLEGVPIPEAAAGLLLVFAREQDGERQAAAAALGALGLGSAAPVLRRALEDERDSWQAHAIARALVACQGADAVLARQAVEAFAGHDPEEGAVAGVMALGRVIAEDGAWRDDGLAQALLARSAVLPAGHGRRLRGIVHRWPLAAARQALLADLAGGRVEDGVVQWLLLHPHDLRQHAAAGLRDLAGTGGVSAGLAAALLGEPGPVAKVLAGGDPVAVRAVCIAGRLAGLVPPADPAAALAVGDPRAAAAAERWLGEMPDPSFRSQVLARRRGELAILGRRPGWDPGHFSRETFDDLEDLLRERMRRADPPLRIRALLSAGYWGDRGQVLVEERAGAVRLVVLPDQDRVRSRDLDPGEWAAFRDRLAELAVDRLPAAEPAVHDGIQYEHVELDDSGGFRVWMNNPQSLPASPWDLVVWRWRRLVEARPMAVRWPALDAIPGARVLHDCGRDPRAVAVAGAVVGEGLRLLTVPRHGWGEQARHVWWEWTAQGPAGPATAPAGWPPPPPAHRRVPDHLRSGWRAMLDGAEIAPLEVGSASCALVRLRPGSEPEALVAGLYAHPIVADGTRLVVAVRALGGNWAGPQEVVVVDPAQGTAVPCATLAGARWRPLAWIPARSAVLLEREEEDGRADSADPAIAVEGRAARAAGHGARPLAGSRAALLDPRSGLVTWMEGEVRPFHDQDARPLQPVDGVPGLVWAAIPDDDGTALLRFDPAGLRGEEVAFFPGLTFRSSQCWFDAAGARLLVWRRGDLLELPLGK